jgi:alpha-L-rhamnosidase
MYGEIVSGWQLEDEQLTMEVEIPANTTATIHIPGDSSGITINGSSLAKSGIEFKELEGKVLGKTGSGTYTIQTSLQEP